MLRLSKGASKTGLWLTLLAMAVAMVFSGTTSSGAAEVIKVGACPDLAGPTSTVGQPFSSGIRGYFNYINSKGGINGRKVEYKETDGGYKVPAETAAFNRFAVEGIVAFIPYSGGGTLQIGRMCAKKKIVMFPASLAEVFANVEKFPYSFLPCATYDQIWRVQIDYLIKKKPGKKLRAAIAYPDNGYGRQNVDMIKKYLKKRGVELAGTEIVQFRQLDARTQMMKIKKLNVDMVFMPQIEGAVVVIMRDAKKVGIDTKKVQFLTSMAGMGPAAIKLGKKDIEDLIAGAPFSSWVEQDLPAIKVIRQVNPKKKYLHHWYMFGWTIAAVMSEGMRELGKKEVTGENLKGALETLKNFDTGGLTSPVSFTPDNHIGGRGVKLYRPNFKTGYFEPMTGFIYPK